MEVAVMLAAPTRTLLKYESPQAGKDWFDHTLVLLTKEGPLIAFPCLNVDPSLTEREWPPLGHGVYGVWKGRHHYKKSDESDGFFITRLDAGLIQKTPHWQVIYNSPGGIRQNLPSSRAGAVCDWINIHAAGTATQPAKTDWSEGCFTLPYRHFTALYSSYPDHVPGILSYAADFSIAFEQLRKAWPSGVDQSAIAKFKEV